MLLFDIQKFISNTMKNDSSFNDKVEEYFGREMTYFADAHILDEVNEIPSFVTYGLESIDEKNDKFYIVQFVITALIEEQSIEEDGIRVYPTKKFLEELAMDSVASIKNEIKTIGINGNCNIQIAHYNLSLSYIGEAEDLQAIVTLRFDERKFI